jgi:hypothetical protein
VGPRHACLLSRDERVDDQRIDQMVRRVWKILVIDVETAPSATSLE